MSSFNWEECTVVGAYAIDVKTGAYVRTMAVRAPNGDLFVVRHCEAEFCTPHSLLTKEEFEKNFFQIPEQSAKRNHSIVAFTPSFLEACRTLGVKDVFPTTLIDGQFPVAYVDLDAYRAWMPKAADKMIRRLLSRLRNGDRVEPLLEATRYIGSICTDEDTVRLAILIGCLVKTSPQELPWTSWAFEGLTEILLGEYYAAAPKLTVLTDIVDWEKIPKADHQKWKDGVQPFLDAYRKLFDETIDLALKGLRTTAFVDFY